MDKQAFVTQVEQRWQTDARWQGISRPYSAEDVWRVRGSVPIEYTLARRGAERLWALMHSDPYVAALSALTGNQAIQEVKAGLKAIYVSGWQVAGDMNDAGEIYPDQSLYPANSVPSLVGRINNALLRADGIHHANGDNGIDWLVPPQELPWQTCRADGPGVKRRSPAPLDTCQSGVYSWYYQLLTLTAMATATAERPTTLLSAALRRDGRALANGLAELGRLYQFHDRDCICCYDVSVTQCRALQLLADRGSMTLNELAAGLYLEKSTVSRVVNALERKEYARRTAHPDDGRAVQVELSRRGQGLVERIEDDLAVRHATLLAEFTPEVRQAAIDLLSRLAQAAAERVDTTGGKCCVVAA